MGRKLNDCWGPIQLEMVESEDDRLVARGEFGRCGVPTANGRVYEQELIEREVDRLQEKISQRALVGELDHPDDGKNSLKRTSHVITDLRVESNGTVVGKLEVLEGTEQGDQLKALIENNVSVGVSSRGLGSIKTNNEGHKIVQDDFKMLTYDVVADPAVESAQPKYERTTEDTSNDQEEKEEDEKEEVSEHDESFATKKDVYDIVSDQVGSLEEKFIEALHEPKQPTPNNRVATMTESNDSNSDDKAEETEEGSGGTDDVSEEVMSMQREIEDKNEELSSLRESLQDTVFSKMMYEALIQIDDDHHDRFLEIVGSPYQYESVESFQESVDRVRKDFIETGRGHAGVNDSSDVQEGRVEELEEENEELLRENEELRERVSRLEEDVSEKRELIEEADEAFDDMELMEDLLDERDDLLEEKDELLDEASQTVRSLREQNEALDREVEELEEDLYRAEGILDKKDRKIQKYQELTEKNRESFNSLKETAHDYKKKAKKYRLEAKKLKKAIGARKPNEVMDRLSLAEDEREIEEMSEDYYNSRPVEDAPTSVNSDSKKDPLNEEHVQNRIMNVVKGENSNPEINEAIQSHVDLGGNGQLNESTGGSNGPPSGRGGKKQVEGLDADAIMSVVNKD